MDHLFSCTPRTSPGVLLILEHCSYTHSHSHIQRENDTKAVINFIGEFLNFFFLAVFNRAFNHTVLLLLLQIVYYTYFKNIPDRLFSTQR